MPEIRCLHTADLHLDAPFPSLGENETERREDFLKTFERLLTLAIKYDVHLFLVAGDLFDNPRPRPAVVARVQAGLKRLADRGIVPVLIPGTHDNAVAPDSVFRREAFPGAVLLDAPRIDEPRPVTTKAGTVYLYGFAYRSHLSADALAGMKRRSSEGVHIGLLHGSRQGSPSWDHRRKDLPFRLDDLKEWNLDYVALGHYHQYELLQDEGRIYASYPGSPEGKRFGENGPRYCSLVSIGHGFVKVTPIETHGRMLEEMSLDLSGLENEEAAVQAVGALGRPELLARLTLTGTVESPIHLERLQARCADRFFHLELIDRTRLFDSDLVRRIEGEQTVRGIFVRQARQLLAQSPPEEKGIIEEAFREVLVRFRDFGGGNS